MWLHPRSSVPKRERELHEPGLQINVDNGTWLQQFTQREKKERKFLDMYSDQRDDTFFAMRSNHKADGDVQFAASRAANNASPKIKRWGKAFAGHDTHLCFSGYFQACFNASLAHVCPSAMKVPVRFVSPVRGRLLRESIAAR